MLELQTQPRVPELGQSYVFLPPCGYPVCTVYTGAVLGSVQVSEVAAVRTVQPLHSREGGFLEKSHCGHQGTLWRPGPSLMETLSTDSSTGTVPMLA